MKVRDIQIDGFGVWSGLSVDSLPEGMTVFYGPNEAGKTTLMDVVAGRKTQGNATCHLYSVENRAVPCE